MTKKFPTLYKKDNKGKIREWEVVVEEDPSYNIANIFVTHGEENGAKQTRSTMICSGKNIGKANETSIFEQACSEAESKWNKQKDKGYGETIVESFRPMLAQSYADHAKKIIFPCYVQPKLDGCLTGDSLLKTKEHGLLSISEIVDKKIDCRVLCYNTKTSKKEYKKVLNYFINRKINESVEWYEIETLDGKKLRLTGNHKVYLPELDCWRRADELKGDESLMLM